MDLEPKAGNQSKRYPKVKGIKPNNVEWHKSGECLQTSFSPKRTLSDESVKSQEKSVEK